MVAALYYDLGSFLETLLKVLYPLPFSLWELTFTVTFSSNYTCITSLSFLTLYSNYLLLQFWFLQISLRRIKVGTLGTHIHLVRTNVSRVIFMPWASELFIFIFMIYILTEWYIKKMNEWYSHIKCCRLHLGLALHAPASPSKHPFLVQGPKIY